MNKPPLLAPPTLAFAVTGNPVLHSKSPYMFNDVFQEYPGEFVERYWYGRLAADSAREALYLFNQLGLLGMNVTAPFKQEIMPYLDLVDPHARRIGGVNTVVRRDGGLIGYNTDYIGVVEALIRRNIPIANRRFVVLGAGGAGCAAAYGLVRAEAEVVVVNRSYERAANAAKMACCCAGSLESLPTLLSQADVLISTLAGNIDVVDEAWLKPNLVVFDANYKHSALVLKARNKGCLTITGEEWLLQQAVPSLQYYTGIEVNGEMVETMKKGLYPSLREQPQKIALIGFMASGKSSVGAILAESLGYVFKDLDTLLEIQEGMTIPEMFNTRGEAYFRQQEAELLKKELTGFSRSGQGVVYACGGGAVLAAGSRLQLTRNALNVWLYASPEVTLTRLTPGTRPLLDTPDPAAEARKLLQQRLPFYGSTAHLIVNSEKEATEVAGKIYEEINKTFVH